jgi:flagellar protein FlbD
MIQLTRLNNQPLTVNSDLIKFVEQAPDTVITLITGEKLVVRETVAEICERIVAFRASVFHQWPHSPGAGSPSLLKRNDDEGKDPVR